MTAAETTHSPEGASNSYIPFDKSWLMRMGVLDLTHEREDIACFLGGQPKLGEDLTALEQAVEAWPHDEPVPVGESGTLYRFLSFVAWKHNLQKEFIPTGSLLERPVTRDPRIIGLPQAALLRLDGQTSQWASAAALTGDPARLENPPYKLGLTYEAIAHWHEQDEQSATWQPRYDETIAGQAGTYKALLQGETPSFAPSQAEDYCFGVAFGYTTLEEGGRRWPSLMGHESNRLIEMAGSMSRAETGQPIVSRDHRVVQAIAMWGRLMEREVTIEHPEAVDKSWPEFWDFLASTE